MKGSGIHRGWHADQRRLGPACVLTFWLLIVSAGCSSQRIRPAPPNIAISVRNNAYSLLHQVLDQEKGVSKLLIIKRESTELHRLIKSIANASGAGAKEIEQLAKRDISLRLDQLGLPPGEEATRQAISSTQTRKLLLASGDDFELDLLLTQSEALSYAWHLALVAAANERQPALARYLADLGGELQNLHERVVTLLRSHRSTAKS